MMRGKKIAMTGVLALVGGAAQAGVLFNPNGTGGSGAIDVGTFDWAQTAFVAVGGNQAVANFNGNNCAQSCEFTVYTQARLNGTNSQSNASNTPQGLNRNFEVTMVLGFKERVTSVIPPGDAGQAVATFRAVPTGESFLEVFRDAKVDANPLTGYGFNDGQLILTGSGLTAARGLFSVNEDSTGTGSVPIDRFGTDEYNGQLSVTGQGGTGDFSITNLNPDLNYFTNGLADFGVTMANISQTLPFVTVDPMDCFTAAASGAAVSSTLAPSGCANAHVNGTFAANVDPANGPGSYVPVTGNINGLFGGGPDFVAQTDYNSTLRPAGVPPTPPFPTPEPASLAMLGLGLGLMGLFKSKNRPSQN